VPVLLAAAATESFRDRAIAAAAAAQRWLPAIVAIWLAGVIVLSSRLLFSWARARRLVLRGGEDASAQWQRAAQRLSDALGLRRAVRLVESAAVEVPSVIGWLRPIVLLPASTLTGLAPRQLEMVLAHELAHIRRHDFFINLLQAVVETLMFYHPAVWWMSRQVRVERENCCDDLAVAVCGDAIQYARALARLEELRADAPEVAMAANGGSLLARIRRIAGARAESIGLGSRWAAAVAMLSIVAIIVAIPSLPALAQREESAKKAEAPKKASTVVEVTEKQVTPEADDDTSASLPMPTTATEMRRRSRRFRFRRCRRLRRST
jgi:beta-lactamase regulating signal transducer with metallopeptidase domain